MPTPPVLGVREMRKGGPYSWSKVDSGHRGSQSAWLQFFASLSWKTLAHLKDSHLSHHLSVLLSLTLFWSTDWSQHAVIQNFTSCITKGKLPSLPMCVLPAKQGYMVLEWCNVCTGEGTPWSAGFVRHCCYNYCLWAHLILERLGTEDFGPWYRQISFQILSLSYYDFCDFLHSTFLMLNFHLFKLRVTLAFALPFPFRPLVHNWQGDSTQRSLQSVSLSTSPLKESLRPSSSFSLLLRRQLCMRACFCPSSCLKDQRTLPILHTRN